MSFVSINAESVDSQVALQQSLQYSELKYEFEQVLELCRHDLANAWKRLSHLLEGSLFVEGPTFRYQPSMQELQKSVLMLAIDLARRLDREGLFDLLLETVEWFPEEPYFWLQLAQNTKKDYRGLLVKGLALRRAIRLLPLSPDLRIELSQVNFALGKPIKAPILHKQGYLLQADDPLSDHRLEIAANTSLCVFTESVCEMAEEILEIHPKRHRSAHAETGLKLSTPVTIAFLHGAETVAAERIVDENTLQLSQAGSVRNFNDLSSQAAGRTSRRRQRQRETAQSETRMSVAELCKVLTDSLSGIKSDPTIESYFESSYTWEAEAKAERDAHFAPALTEVGDPPASSCFTACKTDLASLLCAVCECLEQHELLQRPTTAYTLLGKRLATIITAGDIDYFLARLSPGLSIWLAEVLLKTELNPDALKYLLPRCRVKISPRIRDLQLLARYLWLCYRAYHNVEDLTQLQALFAAAPPSLDPEIRLWGTFDSGRVEALSARRVEAEMARIRASKILTEVKQMLRADDKLPASVWLTENVADPIVWLRELVPFEEAAEWALLLAECYRSGDQQKPEVVAQLTALGLVSSLRHREDLIISFLDALKMNPRVFLPLLGRPEELEKLLQSSCHTAEFFSVLVRLLADLDLVDSRSKLLILILRDFDQEAFRDPSHFDVFPILVDKLLGRDDSLSVPSMTLLYGALSIVTGCPLLESASDEWGLIKSLASISSVDRQHHHVGTYALALQKLACELVDLELVDPNRVIAFCDHLMGILVESLGKDFQFSSSVNFFEASLTRSWKSFALPVPYLQKPLLTASLLRLFEARSDANNRLPSAAKKKRNADGAPAMIADLLRIIVIRPELDYLLALAGLYSAELRRLLTRDAPAVLADSALIGQLACATHNALRLAQLSCQDASDRIDILPYIVFYRSIADGVLSWFVPPSGKIHIARFLQGYLRGEMTSSRSQLLRLKAIALRLLGRECSLVASLEIKALQVYLECEEHQSHSEVIYYLTCSVVELLHRISRDRRGTGMVNSLAQSVLQAFGSKDDALSTIPGEANAALCALLAHVSAFDKKHSHHLHWTLQAQLLSENSFENVISAWSKVIPVLAKPKSPHLLSVWQTEQDFPGDYHFYCDSCVRLAFSGIVRSAGPPMEKAKSLAMLIGKVFAAPAIFIRHRLLLRDLLHEFSTFLETNTAAEPVPFEDSLKAELKALYDDAFELVNQIPV